MKKTITLLAMAFVSFGTSAFAADTCIAQKISSAGKDYVWDVHYRVMCDGQTFSTSPSLFAVGTTRARKTLAKVMSARGYQQSSTLTSTVLKNAGWDDDFLVFERNAAKASYCLAFKYNQKLSGISSLQKQFDVVLTCNNSESRFNGVTELELNNYLNKEGFQKAFDPKISPYYIQDHLDGLNLNEATLFKK